MNTSIDFTKIVLDGVKNGVDSHWYYAKDMLEVRPEYLLTVSVADALMNTHGLEVSIKLEEQTRKLIYHLWMEAVGWKRYFKERIPWNGRKGWVDIFLTNDTECRVVELKKFDPSATEIKKEFDRFDSFFEVNKFNNTLKSCHLAFPSKTDKKSWIQKYTNKYSSSSKIECHIMTDYFETGTDAEDGIPAYFVNVVSLVRK